METTESDVGYPEEQPPEVDDTPAEGTPQRDDEGVRQKDLTTTTARPPATPTPPAREFAELERRTARSSRGARARRARAATRLSTSPTGPSSGAARTAASQLLEAPHRERRARLGQPVGVEHERVARPQLGAAVLQLRIGARRPSSVPGAPTAPTRAVRAPQHRQRVPAAGDGEPRAAAREVDVRAGDRAEAPAGRVLVEHRLADPAQDRGR